MKRLSFMMFLMCTLFLICSLPLASASLLFEIHLSSSDKGIAYSGIEVTTGDLPERVLENRSYTIEVLRADGAVRYSTAFDPPFFGPFAVHVPYFADAVQVRIKDSSGKTFLDLPTAHFARQCGDSVCGLSENVLSCPQDCLSGGADEICDAFPDGLCDPDCSISPDADCELSSSVKDVQPVPEQLGELAAGVDSSVQKIPQASIFSVVKKVAFPSGGLLLVLLVLLVVVRHRKQRHLESYLQENLRQGKSLEEVRQLLQHYGYSEKSIRRAEQRVALSLPN